MDTHKINDGCTPYSEKIFEFFLADSDRTRRDDYAYIGYFSSWAESLKPGVFEIGNFGPLMPRFT